MRFLHLLRILLHVIRNEFLGLLISITTHYLVPLPTPSLLLLSTKSERRFEHRQKFCILHQGLDSISDTIGVKKVDLKKKAGWIILVTSKFFVSKKFQDFVGKNTNCKVWDHTESIINFKSLLGYWALVSNGSYFYFKC